MVSKGLMNACQEALGLTSVEKNPADKSYLYGVYGGYLISVYDSGKNRTVFFNYYMNESEEDDSVRLLALSEAMKASLGDIPVTDYEVEVSGASFTLNCGVEDFLRGIDLLVGVLIENGLSGVTHCSVCGNKIGKRLPKKLTRDKNNYLVCEHCALEELESRKEERNPAEMLPKKTFPGILGGLCGGLIGIALYFLLCYFVSPLFPSDGFDIRYVFCLLGFLTALLVYQGFRLFSKRPCVSCSVAVTILSVLCTAIGQYLGVFAEFAKAQDFSLIEAAKIPSMWLIHLRSTVFNPEEHPEFDVSGDFYRLLCFSLLFAAIGVALFLMTMYEKSRNKQEPIEIETLRITLQPKSADSGDNTESAVIDGRNERPDCVEHPESDEKAEDDENPADGKKDEADENGGE